MIQMDLTSLVLAAEASGEAGDAVLGAVLGAVIGVGMVVIGAGLAISFIGSKALESIARQPESGGRIFPTMVIACALVEGIALFALLICFLVVYWFH